MIEEQVKIHDRFSLEFKLGFAAREEQKVNDFSAHIWTFIPGALGINNYTYSKTDFYKDVTSTIRLITPVFLLRDIADTEKLPLLQLNNSCRQLAENPTKENVEDYETQIKMFQSIFRSAVRDEALHIRNCQSLKDRQLLLQSYLDNIQIIVEEYRNLRSIVNVHTIEKSIYEYYLFGDEFMSNLVELQYFQILDYLSKKEDGFYQGNKEKLLHLIRDEKVYKEENVYLLIERESHTNNRDAVNRISSLKKYIESQLYLKTHKREDGVVVKQFFYSIAAGISMIFATIISFSFQSKYGNFTLPLFIALIVSYMLKDRIKELSRLFFSNKLNVKYFDNKTDMHFNNMPIGSFREGQQFVSDSQIPIDVMQLRNRSTILEAENRVNDEKIILYRIQMELNRRDIDMSDIYPLPGVNDIIQFNISQYIQKMDNPYVPLYVSDEEVGFKIIDGEKIYYLNFILQLSHSGQYELKRYRVAFNREGIKGLEQFS